MRPTVLPVELIHAHARTRTNTPAGIGSNASRRTWRRSCHPPVDAEHERPLNITCTTLPPLRDLSHLGRCIAPSL
eukprot:4280734-Amphidinium_carterae.1